MAGYRYRQARQATRTCHSPRNPRPPLPVPVRRMGEVLAPPDACLPLVPPPSLPLPIAARGLVVAWKSAQNHAFRWRKPAANPEWPILPVRIPRWKGKEPLTASFRQEPRWAVATPYRPRSRGRRCRRRPTRWPLLPRQRPPPPLRQRPGKRGTCQAASVLPGNAK